ncbi:MAG: alpha/beta hydrolase fold domain-containing protein [Chitinophagaceae bacterium]
MKLTVNTSFKNIIGIAILFSLTITSCTKSSDGVEATTNVAVKLDTMNLAYGTDLNQKMDMYLPANRSDANTKVFVLIHGGAWSAGDKSDFATLIPALQSGLTNYAIININYRLAAPPSTNLWPTQQTDVNAAFDYIVSKANYYHYNANKIAVMGASAGAHLAMLKAYHYNTENRIKAVVDYFGPTDMSDLYNFQVGVQKQLFELFMGGTPATNASVYANASPLTFVTASVPPTIIFHGTADAVVPYSQSVRLKTALTTAGVVNEYNEYAGEPHGQFNTTNTFDAATKTLSFTQAHVQ